jgi:rhodanese-related sulfurtransferase
MKSECLETRSLSIPLSPEEYLKLSNPPLLIDVRSHVEFSLSHAPNAINLSLPRILLGRISWLRPWVWPQWFQNLPKNDPVAVVCLTSHRSPIAAQQLLNLGFQQVYNITGGMMKWP